MNYHSGASYQEASGKLLCVKRFFVKKWHDLSKYTVPTSFVGTSVPEKVVGMLVVSALPT